MVPLHRMLKKLLPILSKRTRKKTPKKQREEVVREMVAVNGIMNVIETETEIAIVAEIEAEIVIAIETVIEIARMIETEKEIVAETVMVVENERKMLKMHRVAKLKEEVPW